MYDQPRVRSIGSPGGPSAMSAAIRRRRVSSSARLYHREMVSAEYDFVFSTRLCWIGANGETHISLQPTKPISFALLFHFRFLLRHEGKGRSGSPNQMGVLVWVSLLMSDGLIAPTNTNKGQRRQWMTRGYVRAKITYSRSNRRRS